MSADAILLPDCSDSGFAGARPLAEPLVWLLRRFSTIADAHAPGRQDQRDIPQAEAEAVIAPDRRSDDLRRKRKPRCGFLGPPMGKPSHKTDPAAKLTMPHWGISHEIDNLMIAGAPVTRQLLSVPQRIDKQGECWRVLAAARVIEMIAGPSGAPVGQNLLQLPLL